MANTVFSANLQALRKSRGVTQEQLANHLGVSAQAVSKWENGSYPEGDLLPKISEFFGVSISYLYGQEKETVSMEQNILDMFLELREKNHMDGFHDNSDYFEKMLNIIWAFQMGGWSNNKTYFDRIIPKKEVRTASVLTDDEGFSFFNLNPEKLFFTLLREPKEGYAENIKITEEMRSFFMFLGKKGVMEIVTYLLTLKWGECATVSTLANKIGMSVEETEKLLAEGIMFKQIPNSFFCRFEIQHQDKVEVGYGISPACVCLYLSLFLTADVLINPPHGYQMQIACREKSWLERDKVEKMLKELRN